MLHALRRSVALLLLTAVLVAGGAARRAQGASSFLATLATNPSFTATTVAVNGDVNPYGVAVVPQGFPSPAAANPGNILVSNFNSASAGQGTGRTIVAITPAGNTSTFFTAPISMGPIGLTTALVALPSGLVVVGNVPSSGPTAFNGSLIFLDEHGNLLLNLMDNALLQGPWDMTVDDAASNSPILYVSEVLSGTVTRINLHVTRPGGQLTPQVESMTLVASGFLHRADDAALVIGPTGLLRNRDSDALYVADTGNNRVQVVYGVRGAQSDRGAGQTVISGAPLLGPLALALTPFGTIVATNGDAVGTQTSMNINRVVEFGPNGGGVVATRQLDTGAAGALFGAVIAPFGGKTSLIYVNDNGNQVNVLPPTSAPPSTPATHFQVTVPASAITNTPFSFTVTALDQTNQVVSGYSGTVHFSSSDPAAVTLPANATLTSGAGSFSATYHSISKSTITATDTANSGITGTSTFIFVSS